jgi:hypothetical protein
MAKIAQSFKRLSSASSRAHKGTICCSLSNWPTFSISICLVFLEDTNLRDLARMPRAREFRAPAGGWQPIDLDRLSQDLDMAARSAKRAFTEAVGDLLTKWQFEVLSGPTPETIASILRAEDNVMVTESQGAVEQATQRFASPHRQAAVMLVPAHIARCPVNFPVFPR